MVVATEGRVCRMQCLQCLMRIFQFGSATEGFKPAADVDLSVGFAAEVERTGPVGFRAGPLPHLESRVGALDDKPAHRRGAFRPADFASIDCSQQASGPPCAFRPCAFRSCISAQCFCNSFSGIGAILLAPMLPSRGAFAASHFCRACQAGRDALASS